jgi:predicted nucleic acid-binding protein
LAAYLEVVLWPRCSLFPSPAIYRHALKIHQETQYRFFDSLIVASALATGAKVLYTEDLEHGREIRNLRIQNPFLPQKT